MNTEDNYWLRELEHQLEDDDMEAGLWIFGMDNYRRVNSHAPGVDRLVMRLKQKCFGPQVQFEEENKFFELYQEGMA